MTIDEAIKRVEEAAEYEQKVVDTHRFADMLTIEEIYCDDTEIIEECLVVSQKRADDFRQLAEWLKELKTLREQTRWIPVSERLPEEDQVVLGTDSYNCFYNTYTWDDCGEIKWYADGDYDVPIVAWIPLPKKYKAGEKE